MSQGDSIHSDLLGDCEFMIDNLYQYISTKSHDRDMDAKCEMRKNRFIGLQSLMSGIYGCSLAYHFSYYISSRANLLSPTAAADIAEVRIAFNFSIRIPLSAMQT